MHNLLGTVKEKTASKLDCGQATDQQICNSRVPVLGIPFFCNCSSCNRRNESLICENVRGDAQRPPPQRTSTGSLGACGKERFLFGYPNPGKPSCHCLFMRFRVNWLIGGLCALIVALSSHHFRLLTVSGSMAAFVMGWLVFSLGGWTFSIPILFFFVSSSLLSRVGGLQKSRLSTYSHQSSQRDFRQVLANGLIPTLVLLGWCKFQQPRWAFLFLTSVASATADTWATEIGVLSKAKPRSVVSFKKVPTGSSGGVTLLGVIAAISGAFAVALVGRIMFQLRANLNFSWPQIVLITMIGTAAQTLDSILGATVQAKYCCTKCGEHTEGKSHCSGAQTVQVSGGRRVDNDLVNLISVSGGAIVGWIGWELI